MNYLLARLKEPSSQLSIGIIIGALVELKANPANATAWSAVIGGLFGFFSPEKT